MPSRRQFSSLSVVAISVSLLAFAGCPASTDPMESGPTADSQDDSTVSDVPLRVWIAAPVKDREVVTRKWLGDTPQPIEITQVPVDELLSGESCSCDVLVYPSRLLGELLDRKWITKLPKAVSGASDSSDSPLRGLSPTLAAQASYDRDFYGLPLGTDIPGLLVGPKLAKTLNADATDLEWDHLLSELPSTDVSIDDEGVDSDAIVDRFLAIAATLADRDPKYGLLLQLPNLQPLLSRRPEYEQAARILLALSKQTSDGKLACGSHSEVWQAVTTSDAAVVAVVPLASLAATTGATKDGVFRALLPTRSQIMATQDSDAAGAGDEAPNKRRPLKSWNVGGGLNVSLADDCSQTAQATNFMLWIASAETRTFLAKQIPGVAPAAPTDGVDALRWQGIQKQASLTSGGVIESLPQEFRLSGSHEYRAALAEGLVRYLKGELDADNALRSVEAAWVKINRQRPDQITDFKKSLGLLY